MRVLIVFSLSLLLCLVDVHSQTVPYVSFMSQTLANHSYVDLSQVGRPDVPNGGEGVQCITDLSTCCNSSQGSIVETGISLMELDCLFCI
ncbi:hypothetical protein GBAR_LOCUS16621 [Geodia barretti]|uniref:Uncharacterized protein n=1 Tax=Geodia barretti TaxID=519541 RepID=A0AA35SFQ4_GEOBA|nr:hypothetical protein GBAR_LOCUS16621 [Geodia barretti]